MPGRVVRVGDVCKTRGEEGGMGGDGEIRLRKSGPNSASDTPCHPAPLLVRRDCITYERFIIT